ncbi:IniB N-terminal domain-containing protein [Mycobacterium sp. CVI_P3]|uniref:IniB N-terminal domain-containing protein n=1 Tax=Mycobacterium pinniadriaticum TaxID=2994102 RepID=A0ABT3SN68_9MYCO|nr:IniB N-terminal domain-containing protein [Mycobacterium pinniadriaticum]MCX2933862.1 IniB N-terminal domain-containing protein [Mycobacterium pinniadriaticum]MCX2940285.1 IniB N-terminal domain-containing protein [Mycobacterium pinniadriaticum]
MLTLLDWILDLFRNEDAARAFVAAPEQTMRDAGFAGVSAAQVSTIAATAVPGLVLGGGDPIVGLQRAVSNQYGFAPAYQPTYQPVYAPAPTFAPETDLASHNDTSLMSPQQDAGANAQQGAFNLGFGDITFGNKTTNTATDGGVVVDGPNDGDIVSGDGAVLGNDNDVNNGDVLAGTGSNVAVGHGHIDDDGTTATGGSTVIKDNGGPVFHDVDASGGSGGGASAGGSLIGLGGSHASGGNAGGGGITIVDSPTSTNSDNSASSPVYVDTHATTTAKTTVTDHSDNSVHEATVSDSSTHDTSSHTSLDAGHDTTLVNSHLDASHDLALASGNHLLGF